MQCDWEPWGCDLIFCLAIHQYPNWDYSGWVDVWVSGTEHVCALPQTYSPMPGYTVVYGEAPARPAPTHKPLSSSAPAGEQLNSDSWHVGLWWWSVGIQTGRRSATGHSEQHPVHRRQADTTVLVGFV